MKSLLGPPRGRPLLLVILLLAGAWAAEAYPPAPYHRIEGLVRDEYGQPVSPGGARIVLMATNGVTVSTVIKSGLAPGVNYQLDVPMDAGIAPDLYKPTALLPMVAFRIKVMIGTTTYLPIEMVGDYANLGQPAQITRLNLTLGEDATGDGLPDAWQQLLLRMLGPNAKIGPNDDADGDGISNLNEYLAGTYAFDPADGFRLNLLPASGTQPLLEFTVINPRTYTVYSSTNAQTWRPVEFTVPAEGPAAIARPRYQATDIRLLQVSPSLPPGVAPAQLFYKVQVQ